MTEHEIQNIIYSYVNSKNHRLVVDNCKALNVRGEADLISVTKSDLIHEFEIKLSKSDFKRDFTKKKKKHKLLEGSGRYNYSANYFWFVLPENVIDAESIPKYAGLILIKDGEYTVVKSAPRRHNDKASDRIIRYLERGVTLRYWQKRI